MDTRKKMVTKKKNLSMHKSKPSGGQLRLYINFNNTVDNQK